MKVGTLLKATEYVSGFEKHSIGVIYEITGNEAFIFWTEPEKRGSANIMDLNKWIISGLVEVLKTEED